MKFIGTGGAFDNKINSSAYFIHANRLWIIDVGENTFIEIKNIIEKNNFKEVIVFITHTHAEHVNGLSTLSHYLYYIAKIPLIIKVHKDLSHGINYMMNFNGNWKEQYKIEELNHQFIVSNEHENIHFSYVKTEHVKNLDCFGITIGVNGNFIYYSGDSCSIPESIVKLIKNKELTHFYQDISIYDFEGNTHMSLGRFKNEYIDLFRENINLYFYHNDRHDENLVNVNYL